MYMKDWIEKLHGFLLLNERDILQHAGAISHEMAKEFAENEYDKFNQKRIEWSDRQASDFDKTVQELPSRPKKKLPRRKK